MPMQNGFQETQMGPKRTGPVGEAKLHAHTANTGRTRVGDSHGVRCELGLLERL